MQFFCVICIGFLSLTIVIVEIVNDLQTYIAVVSVYIKFQLDSLSTAQVHWVSLQKTAAYLLFCVCCQVNLENIDVNVYNYVL